MNSVLALPVARLQPPGLRDVLRVHWPSYAAALAVSGGALAGLAALDGPLPVRAALGAAVALPLWWSCTSLAAVHWLRRHSEFHGGSWLVRALPRLPRRWAVLHLGHGGGGVPLDGLFPGACRGAWDVYAPDVMPHPDLVRARRYCPSPGVPARWNGLPVRDGALDAVFPFMVMGEIRRADARARFFAELRRLLEPGGCLVLAEFTRGPWTWLAFGPGALRFRTKREWRDQAEAAGFVLRAETDPAPFLSAWVLERPRP